MGRGRARRLRRPQLPAWWRDAKLGVFVHWTPASVPGWAPRHSEIGELFASGRPDAMSEAPYTEWYQNSLRFPDSSVARHHREVYDNRPYEDFAGQFDAALVDWDPDEWADAFARSGARYVVLVSKHHDGFCLWPSEVRHPNRSGWHSTRDAVGDLADAVRRRGMRFGLYYSGGLDWTFDDRPLGSVADVVAAMPRGEYPDYAEAQVRELIERYRPSVLWNDITWPTDRSRMFELFEHYYRVVPDGVVNDRWMPWSPAMSAVRFSAVRRLIDASSTRSARREHGMVPPRPPHFDVRTPEYLTFDEVQREPWECVRGMDRSFGYNRASRPEDFLSRDELLSMFAGIVSTGGNLLLNVGPRGEDATIPDEQLERLGWLGQWTGSEGASVFESRPWVRAADRSVEGVECRFWTRGETVWVAVRSGGSDGSAVRDGSVGAVAGERALTVPGVAATPTTEVTSTSGEPVRWRRDGDAIVVEVPVAAEPGPVVVRIEHATAAVSSAE